MLAALSPVAAQAQAQIDETSFDRVFHVDAAATGAIQTGAVDAPFSTLGQAFAEVAQSPNERIRVLVAPGIYREGSLTLQDRQALLVIEPSAPGEIVVSGSDVWTNWTEATGLWTAPWPFKWGFAPVEPNVAASEAGRRSEMVFVDGLLYRPVVSAEAMTAGSFYVDEAGEQIRLLPLPGHDPATAVIEVGIRRNLLSLRRVSNFVLRGMVFQHSVSGAMHSGDDQRTVFISGQGDGGAETVFGHENRNFSENFLIEDFAVEWNNATGFTLANAKNFTLRNTRFRHNGRSGLGTNRIRHALWEGLIFEGNNWRLGILGGAYGWDPAGVKLLRADDLLIRDSIFRGNYAAGLWIDYGNTDITARGIRSTHNWKNGVYYEANKGPFLLEDALIRDNGFPLRSDLWDGGLFVAESANITIRRSFLLNNNYYAIGTRNRDRLSTMYWTGETYDGKVEFITLEDSVVVATRTEHNLKDFPANFGDVHLNGGALVAHTLGTVSWFGEYTAPTYTGGGNHFFSPHTDRLFTNVPSTGSGFNRITLSAWSTATGGMDADSVFQAGWEDLLSDDAFIEADGRIVMEAENTTSRITNGDPYPWADGHGFQSGRIGHAGWGYLVPSSAPPPAGSADNDAGWASYRIHVSSAGEYTLALRHWNEADSTTPTAVRLNGTEAGSIATLPSTGGRWRWIHGPTLTLTAGVHVLSLERPQPGVAFDRMVLAVEPDLLPTGGGLETGPLESALAMPSIPVETPYMAWLAGHFSIEERADPSLEATLWGPTADPDGDGIPNLMEFAFSGHPKEPFTATLPILEVLTHEGALHLSLRVTKNPAATDIAYRVDVSDSLGAASWSSAEDSFMNLENSDTLLWVRDALPLSPLHSRFLRVSITHEGID